MINRSFLRNFLLATPAILGLACLTSPAQAKEVKSKPVQQPIAISVPGEAPATEETFKNLTELEQGTPAAAATEVQAEDSMAQVTSVSQLSDVKPTDWAFQALQSLVERYGCIAGYPDGTYRGNRAMTRYEFAAGLNACMDRVNELIAAATADLVRKEDLATLKKLQDEFAAELKTLRGRVDALEARTATLESQQFSTTTKLSGLVWFNLTGASSPGTVSAQGTSAFDSSGTLTTRPNPVITFSTMAWLTLTTSFTGKDSLVTQLVAGNGVSPSNVYASGGLFNTFGVPFTDQTAAAQGFVPPSTITGNTNIVIKDLFYSFPVTNNLQAVVGPQVNWYRYFDNNRFTFFLNGASSFNSSGSTLLNSLDRGAGAVALWSISPQFDFRAAYLAASTEFLPFDPFNSAYNPQRGVFAGLNTITAELTYKPISNAAIRLLYNRSHIPAVGGTIGTEPIYGTAYNGGTGAVLANASADTFSANFDWLVTPGFGLFGRYGFANTYLNRVGGAGQAGTVSAQSFQFGLAFPDLGKPGAQAVVSFLVPFTVTGGKEFMLSGVGTGKQYELEASYFFPLTDNVAIVPAFYVIAEPNNIASNPPIYVGNFRTQFSF